jgi:glyceraldehyde 3-phosphate dehydrogenase
LIQEAQGPLCTVVDIDNNYRVSSDFIKNSHSTTIDLQLSEVLGHCIKITAWQDNEYGYASQLVQMARHLFAEEERATV